MRYLMLLAAACVLYGCSEEDPPPPARFVEFDFADDVGIPDDKRVQLDAQLPDRWDPVDFDKEMFRKVEYRTRYGLTIRCVWLHTHPNTRCTQFCPCERANPYWDSLTDRDDCASCGGDSNLCDCAFCDCGGCGYTEPPTFAERERIGDLRYKYWEARDWKLVPHGLPPKE